MENLIRAAIKLAMDAQYTDVEISDILRKLSIEVAKYGGLAAALDLKRKR